MRTDIDPDKAKHRPKSARSPVTAADLARVRKALRDAEGRVDKAAQALEVDPRTLRRWLATHRDLQDYAGELRAKAGVPGPRRGRGETA